MSQNSIQKRGAKWWSSHHGGAVDLSRASVGYQATFWFLGLELCRFLRIQRSGFVGISWMCPGPLPWSNDAPLVQCSDAFGPGRGLGGCRTTPVKRRSQQCQPLVSNRVVAQSPHREGRSCRPGASDKRNLKICAAFPITCSPQRPTALAAGFTLMVGGCLAELGSFLTASTGTKKARAYFIKPP